MEKEFGYTIGEKCNRNGCLGVIREHEKEGSCSCHINPPCGYCTTDAHYCPVCDWHGSEDQKDYGSESPQNIAYYKREMEQFNNNRDLFYKKFKGELPIEQLEMRTESHTHFTQIVKGVFPEGTETKESIEQKAKGSFGGRFTRFEKTRFEYIAYTD